MRTIIILLAILSAGGSMWSAGRSASDVVPATMQAGSTPASEIDTPAAESSWWQKHSQPQYQTVEEAWVWWEEPDYGVGFWVREHWAAGAFGIIHCETRGSWRDDEIGAEGELGKFQVHPIHFEDMWAKGYNPYYEPDRVRYVHDVLEPRQGWSGGWYVCSRRMGVW